MKLRKYSSEGIVVARKNYSEADRILVVYTKTYGKLHLLAKGVRKPKSRKRGHIEIFSRIRFSASSGSGLDLITEVELLNSFAAVRSDLKRVAIAYFLMEVIGRVTRAEEKNEELYSILTETLDTLREEQKLGLLRKNFIYKTLTLLGFWPEGETMDNPDKSLEEVTEREISAIRVGKKILA